jgi:hypothetical protein
MFVQDTEELLTNRFGLLGRRNHPVATCNADYWAEAEIEAMQSPKRVATEILNLKRQVHILKQHVKALSKLSSPRKIRRSL